MANKHERKAAPPVSPVKPDRAAVFGDRFAAFGRIVIAALMTFLMGVLSLTALFQTTGMEIVKEGEGYDNIVNRLREGLEVVIYHNDNILYGLLMLVLFLCVCFELLPLLQKLSLRTELIFIAVWTVVLGTVWVYSSQLSPSEDSFHVTNSAILAAKGDMSFLEGNYFNRFPFQLGYVLFNEGLIRAAMLFGEVKNLLFLEVINVLFLAAMYVGIILINSLVFTDQRVRHMTVLLLTFCVQPLIFCSFLYGIIPGFSCAVWALCLEVLYLKKDKFIYGILSAVCLALAVMLKSNNLIVLVAVVAIGIVELVRRRRWLRDIAWLVLVCALTLAVQPGVKALYEYRGGMKLDSGIPYISWIGMGMSESQIAPGWYNYEKTIWVYEGNGRDAAATSAESKEYIAERLQYFAENPEYRNDFFYQKFVSQWNETTYQSIWNNRVRYQYAPKKGIAAWVCGSGEAAAARYMDDFAMLIFAAAFAACIACLRNRNFLSTAMPLIILGGMLYHLLGEAKSQYALPYFILMCGVAAYGICVLYDRFVRLTRGRPRLRAFFRIPEEQPAE